MVAFLKYLRGYVRIRVWGFAPERFLNLCSHKNILLWDIRKEGEIYEMSISLKSFFQLKPIVRKTGTRVAILQRCGLPFFIPRVKARKFFVLGLLLAISFWIGTSRFIWEIDLSGNQNITEDMFLDFLKSEQISVGMSKSKLQIESLEKAIRKNFDQVTWTSAKLEGTRLEIVIRENTMLTYESPNPDPYGSNLVADVEGQIVSMIVRSGVPKVAIGHEIAEGDLLVEGQVPITGEDGLTRNYQYVMSDADIYVKTQIPVRESLEVHYTENVYTGRSCKRRVIGWGEKQLLFPPNKIHYPDYHVLEETRPLTLLKGLSLPLLWGHTTYREYVKVERSYDRQEAEVELSQKYSEILSTLEEKGVQIIEKNVTIEREETNWVLQGILTVVQKVGQSYPAPPPEQLQVPDQDS